MTLQPQGPGWWQASDGRYYPPQAHPQYRPGPPIPPPPTQPLPPKKSSVGWWLLGGFALLLFVLSLGACGACVALLSDDSSDTSVGSLIEPESEPRPPSAPTEEPVPTSEPEPEPEPQAEPVTYEGSGDSVLQIEKPADVVTATLTHSGSRNFAVRNLDADLNSIDLLVNTIGAYEGTVLMDIRVGEESTALEITADGAWTVTLADIATAQRFDADTSGQGDSVVIYDGGAGVAQIDNQGEGNFAVRYYNDDGADLLVNEIGNYSGQVPFRGPPAVVEIISEGAWTIGVS